MEQRCRRCGGELRHVAVLANYKSFVVSLMRCRRCGATVERKENAHRPSETPGTQRPLRADEVTPPIRRQTRAPASAATSRAPARSRPEPAEVQRRRTPAKRIERPFNIRVTRARGRSE